MPVNRSLRVLLISANTEKLPDPVFPIGAAYMAAVADAARTHRRHARPLLPRCRAPRARREDREARPDVVGISLRNLDSSSYPQNTSYIDDYKQLVDGVRALTSAPDRARRRRLHGDADTIMEYLGADVGVVGEGEMAFPWILRAPRRTASRSRSTPEYRASRSTVVSA